MTNATTTTRPATTADIEAYMASVQATVDAYYAKHSPGLAPDTLAMAGGRKFIRIARVSPHNGGRSVYGFVEVSTGLLWKAAGWKGPAKNFPRGSVYDLDAVHGIYSVS